MSPESGHPPEIKYGVSSGVSRHQQGKSGISKVALIVKLVQTEIEIGVVGQVAVCRYDVFEDKRSVTDHIK